MKPKWIEVISIKFKGKRFADHSIDVGSLAGLAKFEDIILQIAKAAWKTAHPDRDRVPSRLLKKTLHVILNPAALWRGEESAFSLIGKNSRSFSAVADQDDNDEREAISCVFQHPVSRPDRSDPSGILILGKRPERDGPRLVIAVR